MAAPPSVKGREKRLLAQLATLDWKVVRLHHSPRGGVIVTAVKNGRVAALELPSLDSEPPVGGWDEALESCLRDAAYDPIDTGPPFLVVALPNELAELVPRPEPSALPAAVENERGEHEEPRRMEDEPTRERVDS